MRYGEKIILKLKDLDYCLKLLDLRTDLPQTLYFEHFNIDLKDIEKDKDKIFIIHPNFTLDYNSDLFEYK